MEITINETYTVDESNLCDTEETVGEWMLECGLSEWYRANDNDVFTHTWLPDGRCRITDSDEGADITISPVDFLEAHVRLIWLAQIENYRYDWIEFAFKSKEADPDEYDSITCDAVLQNLLYGKVIYG